MIRPYLTLVGGCDFVPRTQSTNEAKSPYEYLFRSKSVILASAEADLIEDVCCAPERALTKLGRLTKRLEGLREQSAREIEQLTAAETKLSAAIVAASYQLVGRAEQ